MKKFLIFALLVCSGLPMVADDQTHITNSWNDNWSFGGAVGIQTQISDGALSTACITPALDLTVAKWFIPEIAGRVGFQGVNLKENYTPYCWNHYQIKNDGTKCYYNQMYIHADLMLSATNVFFGYDQNRFANVNPYVHFGYLRLSNPDYSYFTNEYRDREIAAGVGVNASFRITDHLSATADYRCSLYPGRFHYNTEDATIVANHMITFGITYTTHKWYWTSTSSITSTRDDALAALAESRARESKTLEELSETKDKEIEATLALNRERAQVDSLRQQIEMLERENEKLAAKPLPGEDELQFRIRCADLVLYFERNKAILSNQEVAKLGEYVCATCYVDPYHVFYLTGSADAGTGTMDGNIRLSNERASYIKNLLIRTYGLPEDQIVIKSTIVSSEHEDGSLDRCVLFESR